MDVSVDGQSGSEMRMGKRNDITKWIGGDEILDVQIRKKFDR
jgi:hypothetical protein